MIEPLVECKSFSAVAYKINEIITAFNKLEINIHEDTKKKKKDK